jgi:hypothetical protein
MGKRRRRLFTFESILMNPDIENKILDNILTQDQIDRIYKSVDMCPKDKIKNDNPWGQTVFYIKEFDSRFDGAEDIYNAIEDRVEQAYGKRINVLGIQFARYDTSSHIMPNLDFHIDSVFKKPMLTFDIQVKSTIDWPIIVNGKEYNLKDNQALTFSGTHQVHSRKKVEFSSNDVCDMIFCHLEHSDMEDINSEFRKKMMNLVKEASRQ